MPKLLNCHFWCRLLSCLPVFYRNWCKMLRGDWPGRGSGNKDQVQERSLAEDLDRETVKLESVSVNAKYSTTSLGNMKTTHTLLLICECTYNVRPKINNFQYRTLGTLLKWIVILSSHAGTAKEANHACEWYIKTTLCTTRCFLPHFSSCSESTSVNWFWCSLHRQHCSPAGVRWRTARCTCWCRAQMLCRRSRPPRYDVYSSLLRCLIDMCDDT